MGESMTKLVSHCDKIVRLSISHVLQHAKMCISVNNDHGWLDEFDRAVVLPYLHSMVIPKLYELGVLYFQLVYLLED
jgi:hypothetical protein